MSLSVIAIYQKSVHLIPSECPNLLRSPSSPSHSSSSSLLAPLALEEWCTAPVTAAVAVTVALRCLRVNHLSTKFPRSRALTVLPSALRFKLSIVELASHGIVVGGGRESSGGERHEGEDGELHGGGLLVSCFSSSRL